METPAPEPFFEDVYEPAAVPETIEEDLYEAYFPAVEPEYEREMDFEEPTEPPAPPFQFHPDIFHHYGADASEPSSNPAPRPLEIPPAIVPEASQIVASAPSLFPNPICDKSARCHLLGPTYTRERTFPALIAFDTEEDAEWVCQEGKCPLILTENAAILKNQWSRLDTSSYVVKIHARGEGNVVLRLLPHESCRDVPTKTVLVDTVAPELSYEITMFPTSLTFDVTFRFNERVQNFHPDHLLISNAVVVVFKGDGQIFDATFVGVPGTDASVTVLYTAYSDLAGNYGSKDVQINLPIPETRIPLFAGPGSATVLGTLAAASTVSTTAASRIRFLLQN